MILNKIKKHLLLTVLMALPVVGFAASETNSNMSEEHQRLIKSTKIGFKNVKGLDGFIFENEKSTHQVVYLFSYSCPYCYMFSPYIQEWSRNLRDGVSYEKIPVSFANGWDATSTAYYISKSLKIDGDSFDNSAYSYIHEKGNKIVNKDDVVKFFSINYPDIAASKVEELYDSEDIKNIKNKFDDIIDNTDVDGTPSLLVINKKGDVKLTSPAVADGEFNSLFTVEYLIFMDKKINK